MLTTVTLFTDGAKLRPFVKLNDAPGAKFNPVTVSVPVVPIGRLFGDTDSTTTAVAETPVPVRLTVCEPVPALSVIVTAPVRVPAAVGVKVTLIEQMLPAAIVPGQVSVSAKSPLAAMPVTVRSAVPVFVNDTV